MDDVPSVNTAKGRTPVAQEPSFDPLTTTKQLAGSLRADNGYMDVAQGAAPSGWVQPWVSHEAVRGLPRFWGQELRALIAESRSG